MKPFNLERAIAGDPLVTRSGRSVRFVTHFPDAKYAPLVVLPEGDDVLSVHRADGTSRITANRDLLMADKPPRKAWINVSVIRLSTNDAHLAHVHADPETARKAADDAGTVSWLHVAVPIELPDE